LRPPATAERVFWFSESAVSRTLTLILRAAEGCVSKEWVRAAALAANVNDACFETRLRRSSA
jgi:hypothetical protein